MSEYDEQDQIDNAADRYADIMAEESMGVDTIDNVQTFPQDDGSLKLTMDISPDNQFKMIDQGLCYIADEMIIHDELVIDDDNEFDITTRTITVTNELANVLFHFGCIAGIKKGMETTDE